MRNAPASKIPARHHLLSLGIETQADCPNDTVELVFSVVFDFNPAALLPVMNRNVLREMLLQPVFQFAERGLAEVCRRLLAPAWPTGTELTLNHAPSRTHGRDLPEDLFRQ